MLKISLNYSPGLRNGGSNWGYAYGFSCFEKYFKNYKYCDEPLEVHTNSYKAKTQLYYGSSPNINNFLPYQYKIAVTHWESTIIPDVWIPGINTIDELWTGNEFARKAFESSGITPKTFVAEHGVETDIWIPKKRGNKDKIRFLHVDSGSPRKRADLVEKVFKQIFNNRDDVQLTLKYSHHPNTNKDWSNEHVLSTAGQWETHNFRRIFEQLSLTDLVSLYHFHDILVFPSEGEGFGFIPLQALATGMPTISTGIWCSYEQYLLGNVIDSALGVSDIQESYPRPGEVVIPDEQSLANLMINAVENIDNQSKIFYDQSEIVAKEYDWQKQCNAMLDNYINRVGVDMLRNTNEYYKTR